VKPENILVFSGGKSTDDYCFKLTDFGISEFKENVKVSGEGDEPLDLVGCGTVMYGMSETPRMAALSPHLIDTEEESLGAPECFKFENRFLNNWSLVARNVDIWSFACILSEAVVWMSKNYAGLEKYRQKRGGDASRIDHQGLSTCFHDGTKVLKAVREAHEEAKSTLRASDHITAIVIQIIENDVFGRIPENRLNAKGLCLEFYNKIDPDTREMMEAMPQNSRDVRPNLNRMPTHESFPSPRADPEGSNLSNQEDTNQAPLSSLDILNPPPFTPVRTS
jgi:hypothetical protein